MVRRRFGKSMRIIGGKAKGRLFHFDSSSRERPTSDFLRETLFNLLGDIGGKVFVDLFAGSGSVGLEAASRGAKEICFVEKSRKLASFIKKNAETCGLAENCLILMTDVEKGLRNLCAKHYVADIIFADPPYQQGEVQETLKLLDRYRIQKKETIIVVQHSVKEKYDVSSGNFRICDDRKYGDHALTFLTWREENGGEFHQESSHLPGFF
ncbi:MAG TPA: 16S rRNA (guanine(966)-N(2))-methyltransferase RsmD [Smithella sp.]|nr:16S rRNA (guanine(966)-N(2))-methyltransferase RsmD [Smithella sp.]